MRRERKIDKNVEQIINEMRNARKLSEKGKKKKKLFKNKSDSLLDYSEEQDNKKGAKKTPEQNKSNASRFEIHSIKRRKGDRFLIKWEGYSDEENTWEQRSSIPQYILKVKLMKYLMKLNKPPRFSLQFYEDDPNRFGLAAPKMPNKVKTQF